MKTKQATIYMCDHCGHESQDKEAMERHEIGHMRPIKIVSEEHSYLGDYPKLDIEVSNGNVTKIVEYTPMYHSH